MRASVAGALWSALTLAGLVQGYIGMSIHFGFYFQVALIPVPIRDTDQLRETCAGMFGGEDAFIEGMWISASSAAGQLLLKPSTFPRINVPSYLQ